jgi:hypothetical protein
MQLALPSNRNSYRTEAEKVSDQKRFLQTFAITCSVQKASRLAKVCTQTHYDWLRQDPTYSARFRQARIWAAQTLEDEAVRRAIEGVRRPLLYKGKQVYIQGQAQYRIEYSDRLLMRLLEAFLPKKYGGRPDPIIVNLSDLDTSKLTDEQLETLVDILERTLANDPVAIAKEKQRGEAELARIDAVSPLA